MLRYTFMLFLYKQLWVWPFHTVNANRAWTQPHRSFSWNSFTHTDKMRVLQGPSGKKKKLYHQGDDVSIFRSSSHLKRATSQRTTICLAKQNPDCLDIPHIFPETSNLVGDTIVTGFLVTHTHTHSHTSLLYESCQFLSLHRCHIPTEHSGEREEKPT